MKKTAEEMEQDRNKQKHAVLSFVAIALIISVAAGAIALMVAFKREAAVTKKQRISPAVEVMRPNTNTHKTVLETQGVVESARETMLAAEVGGRVLEVSSSLKKGARVRKGQVLVRIDPADYRTALANARVALADAEVALEQEKARSQQAALDWKKLGRGKPPVNALVLRKPYLQAAKRRAESAAEQVKRAERDLERTEIVAPFNGAVRQTQIEAGSVLAPGVMVAELYAADALEVSVPLSLQDFGYLQRDPAGKVTGEATLTGKIGEQTLTWSATPVRADPEISRDTLSATVVVAIKPDENLNFPLPPVGLFVDVTLTGKTIIDTITLPRRAVLEGSRIIVVDEAAKIDFQDVEILRADDESVVIKNILKPNQRVVLTRLSTPVVGMQVQIEEGAE